MQKPMQGQRLAQQRSGTGGQKHAEQACGSRSGWTSRAAATGRWAAGQAPGASLWRSLQSSRHPACGATMRVRHHPKDHAWSAEALKRCLPHTNCVSPATARTPAGWRALLNPQQTECTCIAQKAMLHTSLAGDKIVELVAWLEKGGISTEEELLEALVCGSPAAQGRPTSRQACSSCRCRPGFIWCADSCNEPSTATGCYHGYYAAMLGAMAWHAALYGRCCRAVLMSCACRCSRPRTALQHCCGARLRRQIQS